MSELTERGEVALIRLGAALSKPVISKTRTVSAYDLQDLLYWVDHLRARVDALEQVSPPAP